VSPEAVVPEAVVPEAVVNVICPECGDPVGVADQFCESCGAALGAAGAADAATPTPDAELGTQLRAPPRSQVEQSVPTESIGGEGLRCTCGGVIDADGWCTMCGLRGPSERDHFTEQPASHVAAVCDRGLHHPRNEDAVAVAASDDRTVLVVCDGVTSATDSDVAALAAARAACDALVAASGPATGSPSERIEHWQAELTAATLAAQTAATDAAAHIGSSENPPSCTFVAALIDGPLVAVAWVGDSRAYWFGDDGTATQLSVDDSWASGEIAHGATREVAEADPRAHAITRWLGVDSPGGDPSFTSATLSVPGWVLVCTDGLWNYCSGASDLRDLLNAQAAPVHGDPLATAAALVDWANAQGGHDNITAALARAGVVSPTRSS
jgi:serine/threonine protein phosphatase PrpC